MRQMVRPRPRSARRQLRTCVVIACLALCVSAQPRAQSPGAPASAEPVAEGAKPGLIPWPVSATLSDTERLSITKDTVIELSPEPELQRIARDLAELLRPALDTTLAIREIGGSPAPGAIRLEVTPSSADGAEEAYDLTITASGVRITGSTPAGVFYG
ncbi:MAG: hypothetical protein GEV06_27905, partial [Luteitalea sp.]|nr:hypothetical protein [Luteitalea sp.]